MTGRLSTASEMARHDSLVDLWPLLLSELIGTAVLVGVGLSVVILIFGDGSLVAQAIPSLTARRVLSGALFGGVGGLIAVSPVGVISGAHINPAVTLGFWLMGKLRTRVALGYLAAQSVGAVVGAVPLLAWGEMGRSVAFGATGPGPGYSTAAALAGEIGATFGLVCTLCVFLGVRELRRFTPAAMPVLFAFLVPLEASLSGTSVNPVRTLGPAVISGYWEAAWIYWLGPALGAIAATAVCSFLASRIEVAKLYYFDRDRGGLFHLMSRGTK